ncbi:MAG: hypothetical protein M3Q27_13780 [Actinomycetota bacterium]|nr:hypothetical protein [Actinomycetota bacterium]
MSCACPTRTWDGDREQLRREVERLADRLRTLADTRLRQPCPPYASRADAGRHAAQVLADAAAALEAAAGTPYVRRTLPVLSVLAVGDQVAATGHDVDLAVGALGPDAMLAEQGRPRCARDVLRSALDTVRDVRRAL